MGNSGMEVLYIQDGSQGGLGHWALPEGLPMCRCQLCLHLASMRDTVRSSGFEEGTPSEPQRPNAPLQTLSLERF